MSDRGWSEIHWRITREQWGRSSIKHEDNLSMPVPPEYRRASIYFEQFLLDAREAADLTTTNQTYTMVQGVLQAFRRRLTISEAIRFAGVLPPVLRAIFVADWNVDEPRRSFGNRAELIREVQSLRADHNFAPETAIQAVAIALRKNIDQTRFDRELETLPIEARGFWNPQSQPLSLE
jgi:uncharacterized protein (DUF2267 family)